MLYSETMTAELVDLTPTTQTFLDDVHQGLSKSNKTLPCKYFYDARGSQLFDEICELDEYYLTRTETAILREHADDIAEAVGPEVILIEPGSGSSIKTQIVLEHLVDPVAYVPVDISRDHLVDSAESLSESFLHLEVIPVSADFTQPFEIPEPIRTPRRRVVYFPGSTIGNFEPRDALQLLRQLSQLVGSGGALLIGIDLKKDRETLEAAYDDSQGVTAEFNLNILHRINEELDADFDLDEFEHRAVYDAAAGRIEISLISCCDQSATVGDTEYEFANGEAIRTEYSHKYEVEQFAATAAEAGWSLTHRWTDECEQFAVLCLSAADA